MRKRKILLNKINEFKNSIKKFSSDKKTNKKCVIKRLTEEELAFGKKILSNYKRNHVSLAGLTTNLWLPNSDLKVAFDLSDISCVEVYKNDLADQILELANNWTKNCSVKFVYEENKANADICVGFKPNDGTYSYLGTDSKVVIAKGKNSMNIDPTWAITIWNLNNPTSFLKDYLRHAVEHEFGHALGMIHEHQRADRPFNWNIEWMKENLESLGLPNWNSVEFNYINVEKMANLTYGSYDNKSTMLYNWPAEATLEGISSNLEDINHISKGDLNQIAIMYPN